MRLLIGSDVPASLWKQADVRAWTQRLLWFAEDGDSLVFMDRPDCEFLAHVTKLTGVDSKTLRIHVMPRRWLGRNFDAWCLLDREFQNALAKDAIEATEVVALWPSQEVGWLVKSLDIEHKLQGAAFIRESGGVLANSKAQFRALAIGAGIATSLGGVCHTLEDAFRLSGHLLHEGHAFMVKRCYGGGGAGNEVVCTKRLDASHAGYASKQVVEATPRSLNAYWGAKWRWASGDGAHPVVVEAFVPDARTLYVEFVCRDEGVGQGRVGELKFEDGRIAWEIFPAQGVPDSVRAQLLTEGNRLTNAYWSLGYRGVLSLDTVVTPAGQVFFTEANARFTGSTHLYDQISRRFGRVGTVTDRVVVQALTKPSSRFHSFIDFIGCLTQTGHAFDPESRQGVLPITPMVHGTGQLVVAAVATSEAAAFGIIDSLHRALK